MPRALVIAYHFPPVGGAGVQRTTKFAKHLPEFGYDAVVVAGPQPEQAAAFELDESLRADLPEKLEVVRLSRPEPEPSRGVRARAERWLRIPGEWSRWWIEGVVEAGRGISSADLIFATMSPFESAEAAARLSRETGLPWVADLRDPWALDEMFMYPTGLHRRLELRRMRRLLSTADAVVMNTNEASVRLLRAFPELGERRVVVIPNGYDSADFDEPEPPRADNAFRIVHVGTLHTELGRRHRRSLRARRMLGGMLGHVDILTRSHVYLLEAVGRVVANEPDLARQLEVHLVGELSDDDREALGSAVVQTYGYLPHREAVRLLRSGDLLFLPMHDLAAGSRAGIVPGKTYEYIASGRPILAAVPDGDARDLLDAVGTAALCRPSDVACMARTIAERVAAKRSGRMPPSVPAELVQEYERRALTRRLAEVFDAVVAERASRVEPTSRVRAGLREAGQAAT